MVTSPDTPARPRVDLYSDTTTLPTAEMRQAMAHAEVGNEQAGEDPTVNRLCAMMAELSGKEAAIFLPSGTMCNEIAYRVWCQPGQEIALDKTSHALHFEVGGPAALSGVMCWPIDGDRGLFTGEQLKAAIRPGHGHHMQRTALVSVENTANMGGGTVWPIEQLREVSAVARERDIPVHMDGARLLNAVVASGTSAADYAAACDSVWIDLSKGLGCPVGGVLAGSKDFIEACWPFKHQFGGAMRQAGIIAAAGVYALEYHVDRLADDHENARRLAQGLAQIDGITIDPARVETNILFFEVDGLSIDAAAFSKRLLADHEVRIGPQGSQRLRAVTHLDVTAEMIDEAIAACRTVASDAR